MICIDVEISGCMNRRSVNIIVNWILEQSKDLGNNVFELLQNIYYDIEGIEIQNQSISFIIYYNCKNIDGTLSDFWFEILAEYEFPSKSFISQHQWIITDYLCCEWIHSLAKFLFFKIGYELETGGVRTKFQIFQETSNLLRRKLLDSNNLIWQSAEAHPQKHD